MLKNLEWQTFRVDTALGQCGSCYVGVSLFHGIRLSSSLGLHWVNDNPTEYKLNLQLGPLKLVIHPLNFKKVPARH